MNRPRPPARPRSLGHLVAILTVATTMLLTSVASAQDRQPDGAQLLRALDRLAVVGRVLYVAAHPDDENTRLLAWLENEKLVRAAYLSLTRGDGGQNLIGAEQGPLLGLIRTQELLAARSIDGAEQLFTRARDFGYSKTPDETMAVWDRAEVLADVVWAIRRFQPDVIITRFPTKGLDTHGHHTASAILAEEAFRLAADPQYRPEQLSVAGAAASAWSPKRIAWNKSSFFIKPGEDLSAFAKLDIGAYNAALGESYGEMAARSRSMHKSQGFGAASARGESLEYFQGLGGAPFKSDLFEGIDLSWKRVPGGAKVIPLLAKAHGKFNAARPWEAIPALVELRAAVAALPDNPWKAEKLADTERLILDCSGLYLDAITESDHVAPGQSIPVTLSVLPRTPAAVRVVEAKLTGGKLLPVAAMPAVNGKPLELKDSVTVEKATPYSNPYWLEQPPGKGLYTVDDRALIGLPESAPRLTAEFTISVNSASFKVTRPVLYRWVDPVAGERTRPVEVTPAVTVHPASSTLVFPNGKARSLAVSVSAPDGAKGTLRLEVSAGWKVTPAAQEVTGSAEVTFSVTPPATGATGTLRPIATVGGESFTRDVVRIEHAHIPRQVLFPEADVKAVRFDLQHRRARIGYIPGAGDDVPQALRQVGYEVTMLPADSLGRADLGRFEAIVVGVRAYNTEPALYTHYKRLMDWVAAGGVLVAQYSTANRLSKIQGAIGPYPFDISQERVTDESAAVTFETPAHSITSSPNQLGPADFDGWVQERGLYFAGKWDDNYQTPLSMHDPGEPPRKGGLLIGNHGKGAFIYTGLAFFRQLPAGVPGAYRLFANLIDHVPPAPPAPPPAVPAAK